MADRSLSRRHVLRTGGRIAAAAAVGGLAARGGWLSLPKAVATPAAALDRELRIGYLPITDASALLVAHERGFLAAAGLPSAKPVLFRAWDALAQALAVGEVDAVHLLMPMALQLRLGKKVPLKVVGWGHTNGSALTVASTITRTEQLAGKTLAIPAWWSIHSVLSQRLLRGSGLTPIIGRTAVAAKGEVQLVVMPPADMVGALASNAIAGFTVADPFGAVAEVKGVGRVHRFLGDVWADHACCAITVREDLVTQAPAAVQALTDAVVAAQAWLDANRNAAASVLVGGGYLPQAEAAVSKVFTRAADPYTSITKHHDWHGEKLGFSAFPHASYTASLVDALRTTSVDGDASWLPSDSASAHALLVDDRFVATSLARAGLSIPHRVESIEP